MLQGKRKSLTRSQISVDQLLLQINGGVFILVRLAMLRACEIHAGSPSLIDHQGLSLDKSTSIALEEISQGKIGFSNKKYKSS